MRDRHAGAAAVPATLTRGEPRPAAIETSLGIRMRQVRIAGRYRLQEVIGRGAMREVWRAFDDTLGRPVAVKLLLPQDSDPPPVPVSGWRRRPPDASTTPKS